MCKQYAKEAEQDSDNDAAQLFNELQRSYTEYGDKVAKVLKERL